LDIPSYVVVLLPTSLHALLPH